MAILPPEYGFNRIGLFHSHVSNSLKAYGWSHIFLTAIFCANTTWRCRNMAHESRTRKESCLMRTHASREYWTGPLVTRDDKPVHRWNDEIAFSDGHRQLTWGISCASPWYSGTSGGRGGSKVRSHHYESNHKKNKGFFPLKFLGGCKEFVCVAPKFKFPGELLGSM